MEELPAYLEWKNRVKNTFLRVGPKNAAKEIIRQPSEFTYESRNFNASAKYF